MDHPTSDQVKTTSEGIVTSARASALVESHGANDWHAEPPEPKVFEQLRQLLDYDAIDALLHFMVPLMYTVSKVIERTEARETRLMGTPTGFCTVRGLSAALTMSLSDFMIALGEAGGIETPNVDKLKEILARELEAGTLAETLADSDHPKLPPKNGGLILP